MFHINKYGNEKQTLCCFNAVGIDDARDKILCTRYLQDDGQCTYGAAEQWYYQMECHPYAQRLAMRKKVKPYGIQVECWFPLGGAMSNGALFKDSVIISIAENHGKIPAQIILRWHIQEGFSVIPGATNPDYIRENIQIFDFELTEAEMTQMRSLNKKKRFFNATYEQVEQMGKMPMRD